MLHEWQDDLVIAATERAFEISECDHPYGTSRITYRCRDRKVAPVSHVGRRVGSWCRAAARPKFAPYQQSRRGDCRRGQQCSEQSIHVHAHSSMPDLQRIPRAASASAGCNAFTDRTTPLFGQHPGIRPRLCGLRTSQNRATSPRALYRTPQPMPTDHSSPTDLHTRRPGQRSVLTPHHPGHAYTHIAAPPSDPARVGLASAHRRSGLTLTTPSPPPPAPSAASRA